MKTAINLFRRGYKFLVSSAGLFQSPFDPSDKPGPGPYHLVKGELTNVKKLKVNIHTLAALSLAGLWLFSGCASVEGTADIPPSDDEPADKNRTGSERKSREPNGSPRTTV